LTPADEKRTLWAGQICINQEDESEKMKQLASMDKIYKKAENVLVWLGDPPQGTAGSWKSFQAYLSVLRQRSGTPVSTSNPPHGWDCLLTTIQCGGLLWIFSARDVS